MHLLLTRPDSGSERDALHIGLEAAGHRVTSTPLLTVKFKDVMPPLDGVQGLIVTSRNGLRAVAAGGIPEAAFGLPLFAVGPGTGAFARELGFRHVIEGPGTGRELAGVIRGVAAPQTGALVHLAAERLAFDLKNALAADGFDVVTHVVYATEAASSLPPKTVQDFRAGAFDGVVLMSPRTARVYAHLITEAGLNAAASRLTHFCLSDAVAQELQALGSVNAPVARLPHSQEMLALIAREASDFS
ncbi:uroporphyrinogen-III synthase [Hyphomicrobium sp.]|uniref:uroporphyrinogen-III synthase n=1 Tax=Hyphomicrobium sp. TaxID=82 RepID=UPI003F6FF3B6